MLANHRVDLIIKLKLLKRQVDIPMSHLLLLDSSSIEGLLLYTAPNLRGALIPLVSICAGHPIAG